MDSLSELLSRLKTAPSSAERNAHAIKAAETGDPEVARVLIELINRPALADERGTLVSCLGRFDCSKHFLWLVKLVCHGNWEVSHAAMGILDRIDHVEGVEVEQGREVLLMTADAGISDKWRAKLIEDLLSMFD